MEELMLTYYWLAPLIWMIVTISNRILGRYISAINQNSVNYLPHENGEAGNTWNFIFVLRILLFIPAIIYLWWFFTKFLSLNIVYLLISGYYLLLWITAVVRQLSSLTMYYLLRRFQLGTLAKEDDPDKMRKLQFINAAGDYSNYFLIYLLVIVFTQSWFVAGGAFACLIAIVRHIRNTQKTINAPPISA